MGDKGRELLIGQTLEYNANGVTAQYQIESLIAETSVIDSYVAFPKGMAMKIMLKLIAPTLSAQAGFANRFQETVQGLLKLSSQNIVQLLDYGTSGDFSYLVCEFHKSPTLRERLRDSGALDEESALTALQTLTGALDHAARLNIHHGFLSPLSLHLSKSRGAILTDLGIAQLIGGTRLPRALSDDSYLIAFAAPEVLRGQAPNAASDQYGLAAVFCAMLTGMTPDESINLPVLGRYAGVLSRALSKDPSARFPDTIEFYRTLEAQKVAASATVVPAPIVTPPTKPPAMDRTFVEMPMPSASPPTTPPAPAVTPPTKPPAMDRTFVEMPIPSVPPTPPAPAAPVAPARVDFDRTAPELSIDELRKAAAAANLDIPVSDRTMVEMPAVRPPTTPTAPPPASSPEVAGTLLEIPIQQLREAAEAAEKAKQAEAARVAAEKVAAEQARLAAEKLAAERAAAEQARLAAEKAAAEQAARVAAERAAAEQARLAAEKLAAAEQARLAAEQAAAEQEAAEQAARDAELEALEAEQEPDLPRRPSGELPPEKLPAKKPEPVKLTPPLVDTDRPINRAAPPASEMPAAPYSPSKPAPRPALDATMPEMPAANIRPNPPLTPPPVTPTPGQRTPGLDATMSEMPAAGGYQAPASTPPPPPSAPMSVPYNFNTVQPGKGGQGGRQNEMRYKTGIIDRDEINASVGKKDGLTDMMRTVAPPSGAIKTPHPTEPPATARRKTSPIVWIILALFLIGGAATIGFFVLKALNIL